MATYARRGVFAVLKTLPSRAALTSAAPSRLAVSRFSTSRPTLSSPPQNNDVDLRDPFPLPLSSSVLPDADDVPSDLLPDRLPRPNESLDALRARVNYQSRKRGTLENDLLLATFARENIAEMSRSELEEFDKLMDEPDWDIYYWAIDKKPPPARWTDSPLLEKLRVHARNEGRVVRRMPAVPDLNRG